MSSPQRGVESQRRPPGGYSPDCIDVFYDGPGNARDEPCPPVLVEEARASREKLIRCGEIQALPTPVADTQAESGASRTDRFAASPPGDSEANNGVLRVPLDASLLLRLHGLDCPIELIDEKGAVVARVTPLAPAR